MKTYVFAKSRRGFEHWLHSIHQMKWCISSYYKTESIEYKEYIKDEYEEAKYSLELYQRFRSKLNKNEREYIDTKDNYLTLYNKVLSLDEEVNKLKKEIAKIKPKSEIFYKGQYFESQIFIKFFKNIFNTVFSNGFCDVFSFIFNFFFAVTHRN